MTSHYHGSKLSGSQQSFFKEMEEKNVLPQPRSQSSSAISDVTSPVKLVGKIRLGRLGNNGKSKMAAPRMRLQPRFLKK